MKQALLAVAAAAALAFPGLAATATTKAHASPAGAAKAKPVRGKLRHPAHQMLGALAPYIRTGPGLGQGHVLAGRSPRPQSGIRPATTDDPPQPNNADNLTFGGPDQAAPRSIASLPLVMNYNVNYAIYWVPDGYRTAPNYQSLIDQYFTDVQQESGNDGNVDSPSVQYFGNSNDGPIFYDSTFGGSAVDTHPFPKGTCNKSLAAINAKADTGVPLYDPSDTGHLFPYPKIHTLGVSFCLSDAQIAAEVKRFADSQGWPHGPNTEFFIYTPHNVYSCFNADGQSTYPVSTGRAPDVWNTCSYDYYCAYHSWIGTTPNTEYIYANMPWPNQAYSDATDSGSTDPYKKSDCDSGEHPNGTGSGTNGTDPQGATDLDAADEVINVTSHEHNESVTDPTNSGWWVDNPDSPFFTYEDGDLCIWNWSNAVFTQATNKSLVTNELNGDSYFLQGEWSNADSTAAGWSGCVWNHTIDQPVPSADAVLSSTSGGDPPAPGDTLTMTGADYPAGTALEFLWIRCKPDVSIAAVKAAAVKHTAKMFSAADPCSIVQDDFSADNTAPADAYNVTAKDVHMDVIVFLLGWNGADPSADESDILVGGQPVNAGADGSPAIAYTGGLVPGTKLTANVGTWSGTPTSFTGSWQRCTTISLDSCKTFKTVTLKPTLAVPSPSTTYFLTTADVKLGINFLVTAKNALGTSDPTSSGITDVVGGVPTPGVDTDAPSWSGDFLVGAQDTLHFGNWSFPTGAPITGYSGIIRRCADINDAVDLTSCEGATPFTGTALTQTVNYTPVQADDQNFLVAFLTAKNKNGASFAEPVVAGIVGGHPTLTDPPTVTEDSSPAAPGDTVQFNMGSWTGSPSGYRVIVYVCQDPTDVTQCKVWGDPLHVSDSSVDYVAPDRSSDGITDYYLRFNVVATNAVGFSDDAWSNAGEVVSTS